jgi:hypothetical protein
MDAHHRDDTRPLGRHDLAQGLLLQIRRVGLIQMLGEVERDLATYTNIEPKDVVICHGAVYWLDHHRETTMIHVCHGHTHRTDVEVSFLTIVRRGLKCCPARGCCHAGVCR